MMFFVTFVFLLMAPQMIPQSETTLFGITLCDWYGYFHLFSLRLLVALTLFKLIKHVPGKEVRLKSVLVCMFVFLLMETITGGIDPFISYNLYNILYLISASCLAVLCMVTTFKKYTFKSDHIEKNNVYICLYKPVTFKMFLGSLLGFPLGGMCLYTDGVKYGYIIKKNTFQAEAIPARVMQKRFVVVDTGILHNDIIKIKLRKLIGTSAGGRVNCIWTLKPVLDMFGKRFAPRWWEMIPPTYSMKLM